MCPSLNLVNHRMVAHMVPILFGHVTFPVRVVKNILC